MQSTYSPEIEANPDDPAKLLRTKTENTLRKIKWLMADGVHQLGEGGVFNHVLASLSEYAMGRKLDGTPIKDLPERTQVRAQRIFCNVTLALARSAEDDPNKDRPAGNHYHSHLHLPESWITDPTQRAAALSLTKGIIGTGAGEQKNGKPPA